MKQRGELCENLRYGRRFGDADDFARAIIDSDVDYTPLIPGHYDSDALSIDIGSAVVQSFRDCPHAARGVIGRTNVKILIRAENERYPHINGHEVSASDAVIVMPGAEAQFYCPSYQKWASISFDPGDIEMFLGPTVQHGSRSDINIVRGAGARLVDYIDSLSLIHDTVDSSFDLAHARRAVECELVSCLGTALNQGLRDAPRSIAGSCTLTSLFTRAEDYIRSNLTKPLYTRDLCNALAVSARKLHDIFIRGCGISPHAYLKARRLILVRRVLRSGGASSVKTAALAQGFWHLGNFAHDYHERFGERPSETLSKAQPSVDGPRQRDAWGSDRTVMVF